MNAVHFASGVGLESMRQNKSRDLLWVCQRRALHQEVEARLSEAEGSDYVHPERVISSKLNSEYERSDVILCNSRLTASTFVSMGYPESRLRVVHNGVDTEFFRPDDADDPASHQRDSPCSLRMLFVGSVDRRKGFDLLLAALDRLPESVQLRVAGAASASAVARVARDERVLYLGKLSPGELRAQYRWADVTVLPSRADAFGYVGSESLACGTPVVASDMTGVSEVIADHRAGWVFESGRADSLLEALEQAIDEPEMLIAAKLGTARSNPYLGWGRFARELISVYSDSF
ncbi:glycosyltransferase family 4 protein [Microbacterium sp. NPDC079995]|uniref:glycosyltransferase family 4 protein n=1 Tax=unclassified Microbacterium TaxID=2609290 RepID=UPI00344E1CAF